MDISPFLRQLVEGRPLDREQAGQVFAGLMSGRVEPVQVGALLTAMQCRPGGPTVDELVGAAEVMRQHVRPIPVRPGLPVIDVVGTGGDHAGTFNISTTAALVAAGAGAVVVKHGNRSVTSKSGSSQVLEALGVRLEVEDAVLGRCLEEVGLCFAYAPAHHPAMKHVAPVRRELGFRTIFNLLGPLTNPAGARRMVLGVFEPRLTRRLAEVLLELGAEHAMVVHGSGMDELSTVGPSDVAVVRGGSVQAMRLEAETLGLSRAKAEQLQVESVEQSAQVVRSVLGGEGGPCRDIVVLNAAAGLVVAGRAEDWREGVVQAGRAIDSGRAREVLEGLVSLTNG